MAVFKRGTIYWFEFVFDGRRIQRSTKQRNRQVAIDIEAAYRTRLAKGEVDLPSEDERRNPTIGEMLDALAAMVTMDARKKSAFKIARQAFPETMKAERLTTADVERYIQKKLSSGLQNATINRTLELIRHTYKVAEVPGPKFPHLSEKGNERRGFFSAEEFRRVSSHLPEDLRDFALFGFLTGWRKGEIASLVWSDIEDNVIRLRAENSKNREARSVVIAGELEQIIVRRKAARLANGVLTDLVFHRSGAPVAEFRKAWASACRKAGVQRLFHDLRRSAVRNMVRSGVPQSVAMKISGHKTASMFRRYDIANEDDLRAAMLAVDRYNQNGREKVLELPTKVPTAMNQSL